MALCWFLAKMEGSHSLRGLRTSVRNACPRTLGVPRSTWHGQGPKSSDSNRTAGNREVGVVQSIWPTFLVRLDTMTMESLMYSRRWQGHGHIGLVFDVALYYAVLVS